MPTAGKLTAIKYGSGADCCTCGGVYKSAHAAKSWHGRVPFTSHDKDFGGCPEACGSCGLFEAEQSTPDPIHYLRLRREYQRTYVSTDSNNPENSFSTFYHLVNEWLIDGYSGVVTLVDCHIEAYQEHATSGHTDLVPYLIAGEQNFAMFGVIVNCGEFEDYPVTSLGTIDLNVANPAPFGTAMDIIDREITADTAVLNLYRHVAAGPGVSEETDEVSLRLDLSDLYTATGLRSDIVALLGEWDFGDDTTYPWRVDSNCADGPLVTYNETTPQDPDHPAGGVSVTTDCDWEDPAAATYDGAIVGGSDNLDPGEIWSAGPTYSGIAPGAYWVQPVDVPTQQAEIAWASKWVERKLALPAHDWSRAAAEACPDPFTGYTSAASAGDFVTLEWTYSFRDIAENDRLIAQYNACGPGGDSTCGLTTNPAPLRQYSETWGMPREVDFVTCSQGNGSTDDALLISPNSETIGGTVQAFPWADVATLKIDGRYGSKWQMVIKQAMYDPLHPLLTSTYPLNFCPAGDASLVPLEEARCSVPGGEPALPAGYYVGCLSIAAIDTASTPTGYPQMICAPAAVGCPPLEFA